LRTLSPLGGTIVGTPEQMNDVQKTAFDSVVKALEPLGFTDGVNILANVLGCALYSSGIPRAKSLELLGIVLRRHLHPPWTEKGLTP
jgi:hypothetical protein